MSKETDDIILKLMTFFKTDFPDIGIEITPQTNLLTSLLVDSIDIVNTTLYIEKQFNINIGRADIKAENFQTIESLAGFIQTSLQGQ